MVTEAVRRFEESYGFPFDPFQERACEALIAGSSVLVAAPTGAGKTVVGEFAAWLAFEENAKTFYTTPIKALSNQKYADLVGVYGPDNVGLLTGDNSINGDAPVVVMTTEVLRNMIYEDSIALQGLEYVVLDEVHYLQDRYRGAVWEEVLIHLPVEVQIVSLSATVSNAEEFAEWLQTLRGPTEVIIEEQRPVEIRHWYFASDELIPMFVQKPDGNVVPNPRGREFDRRRRRGGDASSRPGRGGRREREKRARIPWRTEVIDRLDGEGMLPAIYFLFSRRGCDDAVKMCIRDNVNLVDSEERAQIREVADLNVADLSPNELDVLGYDDWITGLARGVAAHHAGMIPPFKEAVEQLFNRGLVKVVFATETLALGINMPARTVVIENLTKFTGEKHELITPGQYTQLSGRAGRRGIDEIGHSVVLMQRYTPFETITRLASARTYPLVSSFEPSYNMAVNLVRTYDKAEAEHLVNSSFAQFQADRDVVRLERTRERLDAYLASYRERMECDRGDFAEYRELVDELRALEQRSGRGGRNRAARIHEGLSLLRPGDVVEIPSGRRRGRFVVLELTQRPSDRQPRALVVTESRSLMRLGPNDFIDPPHPIGHVELPEGLHIRNPKLRNKVARALVDEDFGPTRQVARRTDAGASKEEKALRKLIEAHPAHSCPDRTRHLHYAERAVSVEREIRSIDRRVGRRTSTLARKFERVLEVLIERGYVEDWKLTARGDTLTRIYNESDLLVVEALQRGFLDGLDAAELTAVISTLVFETRGPEGQLPEDFSTSAADNAFRSLMKLWREIRKDEEARGLELTREPDAGFVERAYLWASGAPLENVLSEEDAPGDFVRTTKQLVDLLRQLEDVVDGDGLRATVVQALQGVNRGVVAYSSL